MIGADAVAGTTVASEKPFLARLPSYVDRILKGAKPADMAVEVITCREFTVSLKAARKRGRNHSGRHVEASRPRR
jgi:ABC-type uncharacterized transport system substrate-binding protein